MNLSLVSSLTLISTCIGLIALVISKGNKSHTQHYFILFLTCIIGGTISDFIGTTSLNHYLPLIFWAKLSGISISLSPITYFHFVSEFTQSKVSKKHLYTQYFICCIYITLSLFTELTFQTIHGNIQPNLLSYVIFLHCFIQTIHGSYLAILRFKKSSGNTHEQMKYFFVAMGVIAFGMFIYSIINIFKINLPRIDNFVFTGSLIILAYSITKKRLMDISIVITRSAAILLTLTVAIGIYIGISLLYILTASRINWTLFSASSIAYCLVWSIYFERIKLKAITTSEKLFLKGHYKTEDILHSLSEKLLQQHTYASVIHTIGREFQEKMELKYTYVIIPTTSGHFAMELAQEQHSTSTLEPEHPFLITCQTQKTPFLFGIYANQHKLHMLPNNIHEKTLVVPVCSEIDPTKLWGVFMFGPKLSESSFSLHDEHLLTAITKQLLAVFQRIRDIEVTIQNLHEEKETLEKSKNKIKPELAEKQRLDQELKLAEYVQKSTLPTLLPQIPNYNCETSYIPAKTVGGDFYTFKSFSDGRIGILIADAVGKGVSAALIVSNFKSIFDETFNELDSPKILIKKLNHAIYYSSVQERHIPMTYGILDPNQNTFTSCNAGHVEWYSIQNNALTPHSIGGAPLGIDLSLEFDEETLHLQTGDTLVLFTDGLDEARNTQGEAFGPDRIEALLQNPQITLEYLKKEWESFRDKTHKHTDDMSIIMIRKNQ